MAESELNTNLQASAQIPPYKYTALPSVKFSIRILVLNPGVGDAPLEGYLEVIDVGSTESYEPISYVWGAPKRCFDIMIHDAKRTGILKTTASLYSALKKFRYPERQRRLWADQICMNQDDNVERSQQVQLMSQVYKNATHVLVWLSPDEKGVAGSALRLILDLDETFQDDEKARTFHVDHTEDLEKQSRERWAALDHLTFTRGWIVQEIGFQAPATLFWGDVEFNWTVLHRVCEKLSQYQYLRSKFNIRTADIKYTYQRFIEPDFTTYHANRFSFIYELHRAREQNITDPRDQVFAFLGHFSLWTGGPRLAAIKADYDKSVEEVHIDIAKGTLLDEMDKSSDRKYHDSALITLVAVQHQSLPSSKDFNPESSNVFQHAYSNGLPSWVPDWRSSVGFIMSEPIHPRRAQGNSTSKLSIDEKQLVLSIHGIRIDTIARCSEPLKAKDFLQKVSASSSAKLAIQSLWHSISEKKQFNFEEIYRNGETALFAFMQTLSNGCIQNAPRKGPKGKPYHDIPNSTWFAHQAGYLAQALRETDELNLEIHEMARTPDAKDGYLKWSRAANGASRNRIFAATTSGHYVLGPIVMKPGDMVCVFLGGKMPFVIRPWGERYLLVGECYVHGLMNGEAIDLMNGGEAREEVFDII